MKCFIITILVLLAIVFAPVLIIATGEYFSKKFSNSRFKKWWVNNVVTEIDYNNDEF